MTDPTYKYIDIVGTSKEGMDQAIHNAIEKASETVKHIHWFYIHDTRGTVKDGKVACFQVTVRAGFKIED
jgi:flavin-binding protein dodecin